MDESLSTWYRANSRVYVASDHACWVDPKLEAKVRKKRFGTVVRSPEAGLGAMLRRHTGEVQDFIGARCELEGEGEGVGSGGGDSGDDEMADTARAGAGPA